MISMPCRTRGVLFVVCALIALTGWASASLAQEQAQMVMLITVEGNKVVPSEEILAAVKETTVGAPLDLDDIRADLKALNDLGYFSEVLSPEFRRTLGGVKVVFRIVEYPPLKEIKIQGLTKMPVEKALEYFTLKPGVIINRNTIVKDLRAMIEKGRDDYGLMLKTTGQRILPDGTVEIDLVEMRLRNLSFIGLEKTREEVVRREISAKEGEIFDVKAFRRDLQNLFLLGYFEGINPRIMETGEIDTLDVQIEFTEGKTGTFSLSLGYATSDGEVTGGIQIGDTNLFGTGNRLSFEIEFNEDKTNYDLSYTDPWLDEKRTSLTLHLFNDFDSSVAAHDHLSGDEEIPVYAEETIRGWEIGLGRPLSAHSSVSIFAKQQYLDRSFTEAWPPEEIEDPEHPGEMKDNPAYRKPPSYLPPLVPGVDTNSLTLQWEYKDLTPQEAKYVYIADGIRSKVSAEFAGGFLGGDTDFTKYLAESAFFKSLSPRDVLALRIRGGYVDVSYDPMDTANFIIGGSETLRGHDYRAFSTTSMGLLNLEYRHRFTDELEAVVFYDYFHDWEDDASAGGYGLGIRYWIPFLGQIRLDYARPTDGSEGGRFHFSVGEVF